MIDTRGADPELVVGADGAWSPWRPGERGDSRTAVDGVVADPPRSSPSTRTTWDAARPSGEAEDQVISRMPGALGIREPRRDAGQAEAPGAVAKASRASPDAGTATTGRARAAGSIAAHGALLRGGPARAGGRWHYRGMASRDGRWRALACGLALTGAAHFAAPDRFAAIVPGALGDPAPWVAWSGAAELACAAALLPQRTRPAAGWATAALLVAVSPANATMAWRALRSPRAGTGYRLATLARLPLQAPLVAWAVTVARAPQPSRAPQPLAAPGRLPRGAAA